MSLEPKKTPRPPFELEDAMEDGGVDVNTNQSGWQSAETPNDAENSMGPGFFFPKDWALMRASNWT